MSDRHPAVKLILEIIEREGLSNLKVAAKTGITSATVRNWRQGKTDPSISSVESVLNALGYELRVIRRKGSANLENLKITTNSDRSKAARANWARLEAERLAARKDD